MQLKLKLKSGENYFFNEEQTNIISQNLNYMQIMQILLNKNKIPSNESINIGGNSISFSSIKSVEFIFK